LKLLAEVGGKILAVVRIVLKNSRGRAMRADTQHSFVVTKGTRFRLYIDFIFL